MSFDDANAHSGIPVTTALEFPSWEIQRYVGPVYGLIVRSMG